MEPNSPNLPQLKLQKSISSNTSLKNALFDFISLQRQNTSFFKKNLLPFSNLKLQSPTEYTENGITFTVTLHEKHKDNLFNIIEIAPKNEPSKSLFIKLTENKNNGIQFTDLDGKELKYGIPKASLLKFNNFNESHQLETIKIHKKLSEIMKNTAKGLQIVTELLANPITIEGMKLSIHSLNGNDYLKITKDNKDYIFLMNHYQQIQILHPSMEIELMSTFKRNIPVSTTQTLFTKLYSTDLFPVLQAYLRGLDVITAINDQQLNSSLNNPLIKNDELYNLLDIQILNNPANQKKLSPQQIKIIKIITTFSYFNIDDVTLKQSTITQLKELFEYITKNKSPLLELQSRLENLLMLTITRPIGQVAVYTNSEDSQPITKMPTLYRGFSDPVRFSQIVSEKNGAFFLNELGLCSTTLEFKVAKDFTQGKGFVMIIDTKNSDANVNCVELNKKNLSIFPNEEEVLFMPSTTFKFIDLTKNPDGSFNFGKNKEKGIPVLHVKVNHLKP